MSFSTSELNCGDQGASLSRSMMKGNRGASLPQNLDCGDQQASLPRSLMKGNQGVSLPQNLGFCLQKIKILN